MSQDAVSVATLIGATAAFFLIGPYIADQIMSYIRFCILKCGEFGDTQYLLEDLFTQGVLLIVKTAGPGLLITAFLAVAATFAQTRMMVSGELMKPKFSRINPLQGFKRLFSLRSVVEALKGILKITVLLIMIYTSVSGLFSISAKYLYTDVAAACAHIFSSGRSMVIKIIVAFVVLAAADFLYQWWYFEREMRMSKQEIKEEYKQTEGDPQIKGKIKEMQRRRAQSRMMQQVPQADVVIRNPTHYAVALRYKPETDNAPIVLAMGQDELALRIVRVAEEAGVAVMENAPLARALYAGVELNREISMEYYNAVAEVLALLYRMKNQKI